MEEKVTLELRKFVFISSLLVMIIPVCYYLYVTLTLTTLVPPPVLFYDNFEDGNSEGWVVTAGTWRVENGEHIAIGPEDDGRSTFAIALTGDPSWESYAVSAKIKLLKAGNENSVGGIIFRAKDADNFYLAQVVFPYQLLELWKRVEGKLVKLDSSPLQIASNTYTLKAVTVGNFIKVYLDGYLKIETTDSSFDKGKIGLRTGYANTSVSFDEVKVEGVDVIPPTIEILSPVDGSFTNNKEVILSYTVSDDFTPLEKIKVTGDPNGTKYWQEDKYTRTFTAVDEAGNANKITLTFTIDRTPPAIKLEVEPSVVPPSSEIIPVTVSGSVTDKLSGIVSANLCISEIPPFPLNFSIGDSSFAFKREIEVEAVKTGLEKEGYSYPIILIATDRADNMSVKLSGVKVSSP